MRTLRWTREVTVTRYGRKEKVVEVSYSNDEKEMTERGWFQDGYYESEGNRIQTSDDYIVTDIRKAPGT